MNNETNLISISKKSFITVLLILLGLMIAAGILTYLIPKGEYQRQDGLILEGTYQTLQETGGFPVWRWLTSPFEVLASDDGLTIIVISVFLLVLGGTFTLMDQTGGIKVILSRLIKRYQSRKYALLRIVVLAFMIFGAFFGIFEESIALVPMMVLLSLSLGWDTMVGLGMTMLAAGFGFASAITNPFSVGIASEMAQTNILSGVGYRIIVFLILYGVLSTFLVWYAKRIDKNPQSSITYDEDRQKNRHFEAMESLTPEKEKTIFNAYTIMFIIFLSSIVLISVLDLFQIVSIPTIPVMAVVFLVGGFIAGFRVNGNLKAIAKIYAKGMLSVAPAILLIMMAASVKYIIVSGNVMDTILFYLSNVLTDQTPIIGILLIYALVLITDFFISSASAKAYLVIPLLIPLASLVGYSKELMILAFIFGDGYTNVIFPTSAVMLVGLSISGVSYTKWFKFSGLLQLGVLVLTAVLLVLAYWMGY